MREVAEPGDERQRVRGGDADPAHAGVDLEVDGDPPAGVLRLALERLGVRERVEGQRAAEPRHLGGAVGGDLAQQQHGGVDAGRPQRADLAGGGDAELGGAGGEGGAGGADRAVPVGVRLDDGENPPLGAGEPHRQAHVVRERLEVDPGARRAPGVRRAGDARRHCW